MPQVSDLDVLKTSAHRLLYLHALFATESSSVQLEISASHNFIAASRVIKFSNRDQKQSVYLDKPIKMHKTDYYSVVFYQFVHLPLRFANGT